MACDCYFITDGQLKQVVVQIASDMSAEEHLRTAFDLAHDIEFRGFLGECYEPLCQRIKDQTTTPEDDALLAAGLNYWAWSIAWYYINGDPSARFERAGAVVILDQDAQYVPQSEKSLARIQQVWATNMQAYKDMFRQWIQDNIADYPCFEQDCPAIRPVFSGLTGTNTDTRKNKFAK